MSNESPKSDILYEIRNQTRATVAMLAGMKLELFSPLKDGPLNPKQLAQELDVDASKLSPLLYALVVAGLLTVENGEFSNTPEANEFLVKGKPKYLGETHKLWYSNLRASLETPETIRSGVPQAKYDWLTMDKMELKTLYEGMAVHDIAFAEWISSQYDFSECYNLLDAGGGSGMFAISMTKIHPHLNATVVDLPQVTPVTELFVKDAGATERVKVIPADLTCDPIPGMYDAAMLSSVIQTISAQEARSVIKNVGKVVNPGGWLYLAGGGILENSRLSPVTAVNWNLVFLNIYDNGQSYTVDEHRGWLREAGFDDITFMIEEFMITARKQ